jgi:hypothetical protein
VILVPAPVVAEVGYLLGRAGGAKIEAAFLRSIVQETLTIVDLELTDYERMAELVETYADFPRSCRTTVFRPCSPRLVVRAGRCRRVSGRRPGSARSPAAVPTSAGTTTICSPRDSGDPE